MLFKIIIFLADLIVIVAGQQLQLVLLRTILLLRIMET